MRVMVIVPASKESEAGVLPDTKILAEMGKFNEELVKDFGDAMTPEMREQENRMRAQSVAAAKK